MTFEVEPRRHGRELQLATAGALLWCAEQAATRPERYRGTLDRVFFALADHPELIRANPGWAWTAVRTFLGVPFRSTSIWIPVLGSSEPDETPRPMVALFEIATLEGGAGQVVQDPTDALRTEVEEAFARSLDRALSAARSAYPAADAPGLPPLRDLRWRVFHAKRPLTFVSGAAAGGQAARGFHFALFGRVPDKDVLALATVESDGTLRELVAPASFAPALLEEESLRTVAVVGEANAKELRAALGPSSHIRVVNLNGP
ncbi:MAG: hypothetical protein HY721_30245 [Planctomycetes bacterium]|nr:hypothetical protein [Planctomycetota bacterium]